MRRLMPNRTIARLASCVAGLGLLAGGGFAAVKLGGIAMAHEAGLRLEAMAIDVSALLGLRLESVTVEGRDQTSREDLLAAVDAEQGSPILSIDVAKTRTAIEALPWVKSAEIERDLPDRVNIRLQERSAYALWQQGNRYTLVDRTGKPIVDVPQGQYADQSLPLIVGADAPRHAADLFSVLETNAALAQRVRAAVRVGERRWNLYLDSFEGGIAVRLPEESVSAAWVRLGSLERDYKILERDLDFIDLRLEDRLIVRVHKDPAAQKPAGTKKPAVAKRDA